MKNLLTQLRRNASVFERISRRGWLSFSVVTIGACAIIATLMIGGRARAVETGKTFELKAENETNLGALDWGVFRHERSEHRESCDACHARRSNSPTPVFPGHDACIKCHGAQFVTMGQQNQNAPETAMCMICHKDLNSPRVMKPFPRLQTKNQSFNMKFSHAAHVTGGGRPSNGCSSCHQTIRGGSTLTIPARLQAHVGCYVCHTPNANFNGKNIGSCATCHEQGRYARATATGKSFGVGFKHSDHSARQGLNCASCHNVRTGVAQTQQVSKPTGEQHFANARAQTCMSCHNGKRVIAGRRVFGGDDFGSCARCHKGNSFSFGRG